MSREDGFAGNNLEPEPAVLYCGLNDDCYDGWFGPRTSWQEGDGGSKTKSFIFWNRESLRYMYLTASAVRSQRSLINLIAGREFIVPP